MSFQNENIGIMDEGYFVSRGDILKWLNDLLQVFLFIVSSTSPKLNNWDQGQSIAKSSMLSTLER